MPLKKYDFVGYHLIANYSECSGTALRNTKGLVGAMKTAVKTTGATLLRSLEHTFPNGGFTMLLLLAESHASIHTYPEYDSCFVDLFTCGNSCIVEKADSILRSYLHPQNAQCRILLRNETAVHFKVNVGAPQEAAQSSASFRSL